jgi:transcriptional regulator GlxA family with amidase domain
LTSGLRCVPVTYDGRVTREIGKIDVARYVADCMRRQDSPRVSELAMRYGVTLSHLSRTFRTRYGQGLSVYIKALQLRRAQRLLRTTTLDTTRVGYACGFATRRTFFRAYRRATGDSPRRHQLRISSRDAGSVRRRSDR